MTRVLYIDDDAGIRRLAARALGRRGYDVTVAEGGAEGCVLAAADHFDLIAVDHYMPGMDGLETIAELAKLPDTPPIVYVTGSEEGRIAVAALKAGAADYVVKTVGNDFFDLLAAAFEQVRARAMLEHAKATAEAELRATNDRRLYTTNDVESVDMREYLGALVEELAETWSTDALPRALRIAAEPIRLPTDRAVSLGIIVTELVTNACKYAYPLGAGEVRVALSADGDAFLLAVEDDGCGMPADATPRGTGLGTKLIRAMAQSLQTIVEYDPSHAGVRATLRATVQ
ncbi:MAG: response regulator [Sphingomonas sp.]|nr:MAG: response regulator [Sphingomonas sp.]